MTKSVLALIGGVVILAFVGAWYYQKSKLLPGEKDPSYTFGKGRGVPGDSQSTSEAFSGIALSKGVASTIDNAIVATKNRWGTGNLLPAMSTPTGNPVRTQVASPWSRGRLSF